MANNSVKVSIERGRWIIKIQSRTGEDIYGLDIIFTGMGGEEIDFNGYIKYQEDVGWTARASNFCSKINWEAWAPWAYCHDAIYDIVRDMFLHMDAFETKYWSEEANRERDN